MIEEAGLMVPLLKPASIAEPQPPLLCWKGLPDYDELTNPSDSRP